VLLQGEMTQKAKCSPSNKNDRPQTRREEAKVRKLFASAKEKAAATLP
jgi:hypothetical protein